MGAEMPPVTNMVQNDAGYRMSFEIGSDGPYPMNYSIYGLAIPYERVPEKEREALYNLAWDAWQRRGRDDVDFDSDLETHDEP